MNSSGIDGVASRSLGNCKLFDCVCGVCDDCIYVNKLELESIVENILDSITEPISEHIRTSVGEILTSVNKKHEFEIRSSALEEENSHLRGKLLEMEARIAEVEREKDDFKVLSMIYHAESEKVKQDFSQFRFSTELSKIYNKEHQDFSPDQVEVQSVIKKVDKGEIRSSFVKTKTCYTFDSQPEKHAVYSQAQGLKKPFVVHKLQTSETRSVLGYSFRSSRTSLDSSRMCELTYNNQNYVYFASVFVNLLRFFIALFGVVFLMLFRVREWKNNWNKFESIKRDFYLFCVPILHWYVPIEDRVTADIVEIRNEVQHLHAFSVREPHLFNRYFENLRPMLEFTFSPIRHMEDIYYAWFGKGIVIHNKFQEYTDQSKSGNKLLTGSLVGRLFRFFFVLFASLLFLKNFVVACSSKYGEFREENRAYSLFYILWYIYDAQFRAVRRLVRPFSRVIKAIFDLVQTTMWFFAMCQTVIIDSIATSLWIFIVFNFVIQKFSIPRIMISIMSFLLSLFRAIVLIQTLFSEIPDWFWTDYRPRWDEPDEEEDQARDEARPHVGTYDVVIPVGVVTSVLYVIYTQSIFLFLFLCFSIVQLFALVKLHTYIGSEIAFCFFPLWVGSTLSQSNFSLLIILLMMLSILSNMTDVEWVVGEQVFSILSVAIANCWLIYSYENSYLVLQLQLVFSSALFLYLIHSGVLFVGTIRLKSRDKASKPLDWETASFETSDFDERATFKNIRNCVTTKGLTKIKGRTVVQFKDGRSYVFNFPIPFIPLQYVKEFFSERIQTRTDFERYRSITDLNYNEYSALFVHSAIYKNPSTFHFASVIAVVVAPVCEETLKFLMASWWWPLFFLLPFAEFISRCSSIKSLKAAVPALIMHCIVLAFPLEFRIMAHFLFNFIVSIQNTKYYASVFNMELLEDKRLVIVTRISQIVYHFWKRDLANVVLSLVNFSWMLPLVKMIKSLCSDFSIPECSIEEFIHLFFPTVVPTSASEKVVSKFLSIFPKEISGSQTAKHIYPFTILLFTSLFCQDFRLAKKFMSALSFNSIIESIDEDTIVNAVTGVLSGFYAVYQSGQFEDFFVEPELVTVKKETISLLERDASTIEELDMLIQLLDDQRDKLAYFSDPLLNRFITEIPERIQYLKVRKTKVVARRVPLVVVFFGNPGTGKTTVIDSVIAIAENLRGKKFDSGRIANIDFNVLYPSEGQNEHSQVIVCNEMQADTSQDTKLGKVSMWTYFQRMIDTAPLMFQGASIPDKVKQFNEVELIIMTTNEKTYLSDVELTKLQRRFDADVVILRQEWLIDGKVTIYDHSKHHQLDQNEFVKFQLMKAVCNAKRLSFEYLSTTHWMDYPQMICYLTDRLRTQQIKGAAKEGYIADRCPCGILPAMHWRGEEYVQFFPQCIAKDKMAPPKFYLCACGVLESIHKPELYLGIPHSFTKQYQSGVRSITGTGALVEKPPMTTSMNDPAFMSSIQYIWWFFAFVPIYVFTAQFVRIVNFLRDPVSDLLQKVVKTSSVVEEAAALIKKDVDKTSKAYNEFIDFVVDTAADSRTKFSELMKIIGPILAILSAYSFGKFIYRNTVVAQAKVLERKDLEKDTMAIASITKENNYPDDLIASWGATPHEIHRVQLAKTNVTTDQLEKIISANLFRFHLHVAEGKMRSGYLLVVSPEFFLINYHYVSGMTAGKMVIETLSGLKVSECCIDATCWRRVKHEGVPLDLIVVRAAFAKQLAPLYPYFVKEFGDAVQSYGKVVSLPQDWMTVHISRDKAYNMQLENELVPNEFCWTRKTDSQLGDCGLPLLLKYSDGATIGGIVGFRYEHLLFGVRQGGPLFTRKDFDEAIESFIMPTISMTTATCFTSDLSKNSAYRRVNSIHLDVIGTRLGSASSFTSSFKETGVKKLIEDAGKLKKKYAIPTKTYWVDDNGNFVSAFEKTFSQLPKEEVYVPRLFQKAAFSYAQRIISEQQRLYPLVNEKPFSISPLTLEDAFFGNQQLGIDRCNFSSSIGSLKIYGAQTRYDLFSQRDGKLYLSSDFKKDFQEFHDNVKAGICPLMYIKANYKDEIRTEEKLLDGRIRVFYTVDIFWNTLCRMYVGPLRNFLLDFHEVSFLVGKVNCSNRAWTRLGRRHLRFGDPNFKKIDMDFKNFDIKHRVAIFYVALFFYILARHYYGEDAAEIVTRCILALRVMILDHKNDLSFLSAILPSGYDATLIINGVVNVLLMLYAFQWLYPESPLSSFWEKIAAAIQGDDNLTSVHKSLEKFNMIEIAEIYSRLGYTVTNASKGDKILAEIEERDAVFLKRTFRVEKECDGDLMAAIDTDSIWKSLCFWSVKKEKGVSYSERMAQVYDVAQREFFMHGREVFDSEMPFIHSLAEKEDILVNWMSFDQIREKYLNKSLEMYWI